MAAGGQREGQERLLSAGGSLWGDKDVLPSHSGEGHTPPRLGLRAADLDASHE